ncbi:hypothetical protein NicSoilB8_37610 [Arthrobacter sp. NicSoilB8]|nr:hypothetical protein NicSoilB8_37610 [Arthrobacter sp. NicSoilB8]
MGEREEAEESGCLPAGAGTRRRQTVIDALFSFHMHGSTLVNGAAPVKLQRSWRTARGRPKISQQPPKLHRGPVDESFRH